MHFKKDKSKDKQDFMFRIYREHLHYNTETRSWLIPSWEAILIQTRNTNWWCFKTKEIYNHWPVNA